MPAPDPVPADASSPEPDRAGPDAPNRLPEWLVHLLARLILFMLEHLLPARRDRVLRAWLTDRPDLPPGSIEALAASIRGPFGNAIAWMCRRHGIGPGHAEWPELSRAIEPLAAVWRGSAPALRHAGCNGGKTPTSCRAWSLASARPPRRPHRCRSFRLLRTLRRLRRKPRRAGPRMPCHLRPGGRWAAPVRRYVRAPVRPLAGTAQSATPDARGRSSASPAVLIRAAATPRRTRHGACSPAPSTAPAISCGMNDAGHDHPAPLPASRLAPVPRA